MSIKLNPINLVVGKPSFEADGEVIVDMSWGYLQAMISLSEGRRKVHLSRIFRRERK